jgi:hypothetical protein
MFPDTIGVVPAHMSRIKREGISLTEIQATIRSKSIVAHEARNACCYGFAAIAACAVFTNGHYVCGGSGILDETAPRSRNLPFGGPVDAAKLGLRFTNRTHC